MERARAFQRCVVHETLVRYISLGAQSAPTLQALSMELIKKFASCTASAIMEAAIGEVLEIAGLILALVDPSFEITLANVNKVCQAKTGSRQLVFQAVTLQPHYKKQLIALRQSVTSLGVLQPEINDALKMMKEDPSAANIAKCLARVPVWQDSLRAGAQRCKENSVGSSGILRKLNFKWLFQSLLHTKGRAFVAGRHKGMNGQ